MNRSTRRLSRPRAVRRLFTAAVFTVLAAVSLPSAVHAAHHRTGTSTDEWTWDDFWDDAPRPAGSFENGWSPRTEVAASSFTRTVSATTPTGPQPQAILARPNDNSYLEAGRAVALSGGNALVSSNINQYSVGSEVFLYHNVDTATSTVTQTTSLTISDGHSDDAGNTTVLPL